jgi:hypothetical protein
MAKKEITEYEQVEETVTKIKCGNCDETWDSRGVRGKQGVNTVILDCRIEENSYTWRNKGFDRTLFGDSGHRINGEAIEDYCHDCWDSFFDETAFVEVKESDYYVEEKTREEYYCDFCNHKMGDEVDHEVTLNPRIKIRRRARSYPITQRSEAEVLTREYQKTVRGNRDDRMSAERDECFDCCEDCAEEIFKLSSSEEESPNLVQRLANTLSSIVSP